MTVVPFDRAQDIGDRFLALLSRHDINPPTGSSFEDELLSLTQLIEVMKDPSIIVGSRRHELFRAAAGLHDFAAKVLATEPLPEFSGFLPHLRLIGSKKLNPASLAQNVDSKYNDDTARKMAELYVGCLAAHVGSDVDLDSPTCAKGDNPDVIFTLTPTIEGVVQKPEKWALAIKTVSSTHGQTIFERIKEGAKQIDAKKCPADKGLVLINAKNALDHDELASATYSGLGDAINALDQQLTALANASGANRPQCEWDDVFSRKTKRPVLFLGQSLVYLETQAGDQIPTALKMLKPFDASGEIDASAYKLAECLNHFMQTVLIGQPAGAGQPPT